MIPSIPGSAKDNNGPARFPLDLSLMATEEVLPDGRYLVLYRARWRGAIQPRPAELPPKRSAPPSYRASVAEA